MPAVSELLTRRNFFRKTSGIALLPQIQPDILSPKTEQNETASDVFLLGQQVSVDTRGKVVVANLFTGVEKQLQLPVGNSFSVVKISPNGELAGIWCSESSKRKSTFFTVDLVNPGAPAEKVSERQGNDPIAYVRWSPDSQWLYVNHGTYQQQSWELFYMPERKQLWAEYGYYSGGPVTFSPNGRWMLEAKPEQRMLFDLQTRSNTRWRMPMSGSPFDTWSPDSSRVALITTDGKNRNLLCIASMEADQLQVVGQGSTPFGFSPDNRFLVYLESYVPAIVAIFDTTTGRKKTIANLSLFYQGAEVIFINNVEFRMVAGELIGDNRSMEPVVTSSVINAETGQMENQKQIKLKGLRTFSRYTLPDPPLFINSSWIGGISIDLGQPALYAISLKSGGIVKINQVGPGWPESVSDEQIFVLPQQAAIRTGMDAVYLPKDGKLYPLAGRETVQLLQVDISEDAVNIPVHILESLPGGETLDFVLGDLVSADNKTWWYLRNNKRYPISDPEKFPKNTRFDRNKHKIPTWALDAIEVGDELLGDKPFFLDWDETYKETQKDGGRMILFTSGYDTDSESHFETFDKIKRVLAVKGWKYTQFLDATYNVEVDPRTHTVIPLEYSKGDTKRYPPQNLSRFNLLLGRYKDLLPRTKFILIGHSLGGYMAFHAAQEHTDAVETVVTLDSPLKGVDRSFWNEYSDILAHYIGKDCGEYLVAMGDDPKTAQEVEAQAMTLKKKGVRVFTLTNEDDWFVRNEVALLNSSTREQKGNPVQLLWQLGHTPVPRWNDATEIITGHGQILRDANVMQTIASILA